MAMNSVPHQEDVSTGKLVRQKSVSGAALVTERISSSAFASGTLPSATPVVVAMAGAPLPCTVDLKSSDAGRLIEWSADNGVTYFTAIYDYTTASQLVFFIDMPITHLRFTGAAAGTDTYRVT